MAPSRGRHCTPPGPIASCSNRKKRQISHQDKTGPIACHRPSSPPIIPTYYKLDWGVADDPHDLAAACVAQKLYHARISVNALAKQLAAGATLSPEVADALRARCEEALAVCEDGHQYLENSYLIYHRHQRDLAAVSLGPTAEDKRVRGSHHGI